MHISAQELLNVLQDSKINNQARNVNNFIVLALAVYAETKQ